MICCIPLFICLHVDLTHFKNAALVIGTYGVTALSHVVKDSDKGSVIVSVPMVKVPKTVADAVMNLWRIGNHVWTKNVLQVSSYARLI